jgi:hypothetical protein
MIPTFRTPLLLAAVTLAGAAGLAGCQTNDAPAPVAAQRPADGQAVTRTVYVAPQKARCVGVAPMECLQVRNTPNEPWSLWYAGIEGFDFQPGFQYVLEINEYKVPNPPADGSSIHWVLKRVVQRQPG